MHTLYNEYTLAHHLPDKCKILHEYSLALFHVLWQNKSKQFVYLINR